ncbi:MAG: hypothetical protein WC391_04450 [Methanoregula sp.]|jgi:hypothetical protein
MNRFVKLFVYAFLVLLVITLIAGYISTRNSVVVPHIKMGSSDAHPLIATHTFPFERGTVTITFPINTALYQGAKTADKSVSIYGNISENVWVAESYRAMVMDPAQDQFYTGLAGELRRIKNQMGLSDDEYLELITVYVQSITYETTPENPAKYPVEVVVEGSGDCDDKSLLLAGLLSHEGYNVSLLAFDPESHMAVGIGSENMLYKNTGYSYIETTDVSFVGVPPDTLSGGVTLNSDPLVIPIGNGTKIFHSGKQVQYIQDMYTQSLRQVSGLETQVKTLESEMNLKHSRITAIESQMQIQKNSGNIPGYNAQVSTHNALVSEYNTQLASYRQLYSHYETVAGIHNYILGHQYDRKGVYEYVKSNGPS